MTIAGFVLGIAGIFGWAVPLVGLPLSTTGLILSIRGRKKYQGPPGIATAGIILNAIFLTAAVISSIVVTYLGYKSGFF